MAQLVRGKKHINQQEILLWAFEGTGFGCLFG